LLPLLDSSDSEDEEVVEVKPKNLPIPLKKTN
jgi:hypothetical protein